MRRASARTLRAAAPAGSSHSDRARTNPPTATIPSRNKGTCHNCRTDRGSGPFVDDEFVAIALLLAGSRRSIRAARDPAHTARLGTPSLLFLKTKGTWGRGTW